MGGGGVNLLSLADKFLYTFSEEASNTKVIKSKGLRVRFTTKLSIALYCTGRINEDGKAIKCARGFNFFGNDPGARQRANTMTKHHETILKGASQFCFGLELKSVC